MITAMFFRLLPVQILLVAIGSLNSIIDGAMASNLIGQSALMETGLFAPILTLVNAINAVLLGGSSILCGQFLGKNRVERTNSVFSLDMLLLTAVGIVLTLICLVVPSGVGTLLGARGDALLGLQDYIRGYAPGFIPAMMAPQLSAFLQLERQEKRTYAGIGVMLICNTVLDYLFVGVLQMGMFGLGLATTLSNWAFLIVLVMYYFGKKAVIRFDIRHIILSDLKDIFRIGLPGAVTQAALMLRGFFLNYMILHYAGETGMSAFSALNTFGGIFYAVTAGVAMATRLLVSIYIGEEDRTGVLLVMKTAVTKGIALVVAVAALVVILSVPLTGIFFHDPGTEIYRLTLWGFRLFPVSMPLSAFLVVFVNYYQCREKMLVVNIFSLVDGLLGTVVAAFMFLPAFAGMGIWYAQIMNGIFTTLLVFAYAWIKNRSASLSVEKLTTLEEDFGVAPDCRMDLTIRTLDAVINTSEDVISFCKAHQVDETRVLSAGLCVEEMAGNIVKHGFSMDKKEHSIDARVQYHDGELLLRFRDDCRPFNPEESAKLFDPEDMTHNIGIRMVSRIAKQMKYQNMLGMNVLTIRL